MRTDLELRHLRVLLSVHEHGGVTRAARALGVSQSSISETLAALERAVGTPVVSRVGRGVVLTPAGEALLGPAREMVGLAARALDRVAEASRAAQAVLRLGANESVSSYILPGPLAALRARRPAARVDVTALLCDEIRDAVRSGRLDLGLTLEPADDPVPDGETLGGVHLAFFTAPGHRLAGRPVAAADLVGERFVLSDSAGSFHTVLRRFFERGGFGPPRSEAVGTVEGVKRNVAAGGGIGLLPAFAVADEVVRGTLAELTLDPPAPAIALRARAATDSILVRELLHELRAPAPAP